MNDILDDIALKETKPLKRGKFIKLLHGIEIIAILALVLGLLEKIEHTQFIPGVSLVFWALIIWAAISLFIFLAYEKSYGSKNPLNYIMAFLFGLLLAGNSLGRLEKLEHTQFIPGVSMIYWAMMSCALGALFFPIYHQWKKGENSILITVLSTVLSVLLALRFISIIEIMDHVQFIPDVSLRKMSSFFLIAIILIILIFIARKGAFKGYGYHYLRFLSLVFIGF